MAKGRKECSAADVPAVEEGAPKARGPVEEKDVESDTGFICSYFRSV